MKFLADENVDQQIVASLRSSGHDVVYIAELDPGITDEQVLALANGQGCLLITEDKDFGELVFRMRRQSHGIILLRLAGKPSPEKSAIATWVVTAHGPELQQSFTVVTGNGVRIRRQR